MVCLGRAVGLLFTIDAAEDIVLRRPFHVVAHEQIEKSVAVEVEPQRRCAERRPTGEAARPRDVGEGAFAVVVKEPVLSDARDQQIGKAVVVVIADRDAHPVHLNVETRRARDVAKRSIAVVAIEAERGALACMARPVHAVHKKNVLPAVAVVIQKRTTGAERLGQIGAAECAAVVAEAHARCRSYVDKVKTGRPGLIEERVQRQRRRRGGLRGLPHEVAPRHGSFTRPCCIA